jgi:hypothetical protein
MSTLRIKQQLFLKCLYNAGVCKQIFNHKKIFLVHSTNLKSKLNCAILKTGFYLRKHRLRFFKIITQKRKTKAKRGTLAKE